MVAANVLWQTIVARLLRHLFELQQAGGFTTLMHTETRSVKCTFVGAKEEVDVFACVGPLAQSVACGGGYQPSWTVSKVGPHWV